MSTVHVAVIQHKFGNTKFAATTRKLLVSQVALFCRDQWDEDIGDIQIPDDDEECIAEYFEASDTQLRASLSMEEVGLTENDMKEKMATKKATIDYINVYELEGFEAFFKSVDYEAPISFGDASFTLTNKETVLRWLKKYCTSSKLIETVENLPKDIFFNWE